MTTMTTNEPAWKHGVIIRDTGKYQFMPPLSTADRSALVASMNNGGPTDKIIVDEDGEIIDGHQRYSIDPNCPMTVVSGMSEGEKMAMSMLRNMGRRNMSPDQKKAAAKNQKIIAKTLKEEGKTQKQIGELLGVDRTTVSKWLDGSSVNNHSASKPPDSRVKVPVQAHDSIFDTIEEGEDKEQVAADFGVSARTITTICNKVQKKREKRKEVEDSVEKLGGETLGIHHGDFREIGSIVEDGSVDLIFTDPPYDKDAVSLYGDLAAFAARTLKPGGWCMAYAGHSFIPEIMAAMSEHLTYGWTFCIRHSGGDLRYRKFKLQNGWKPVIGFFKPPLNAWWDWFPDCVSGGKEKSEHEWQQAEAEATHFIDAMCIDGGLVVDPFMGGGTTYAATVASGRQCIGFDIDLSAVETSRARTMK